MSPTKISDEDKRLHWQAICAMLANPELCTFIDLNDKYVNDLNVRAWLVVTHHHDFIRAKEREMMDIPKDEEE